MGSLRTLHKRNFLNALQVEFDIQPEFVRFYLYRYDPTNHETKGLRFLGNIRSDSSIQEAIEIVIASNKKYNFSIITSRPTNSSDFLRLIRKKGFKTAIWSRDLSETE